MVEVKSVLDVSVAKPMAQVLFKRLRFTLIFLSGLFVFMALVMFFIYEYYFLGVLSLLIGVSLTPLEYFILLKVQKKICASSKLIGMDTTNYFRFEAQGFCAETQCGEQYVGKSQTNYSLLHSACETKTHFFIFISINQMYVIPKADIITGTDFELMSILAAALGKKFKRYV